MKVVYLGRLLLGMPTDRFVPTASLVAVARLSDKAIGEYHQVGKAVASHLARTWNPDITSLMTASNHMETLVGTVWRLMQFAETIRRNPEAPPVPPSELPSKDDFVRINSVRRAIEHMDERIRDGRVKAGDATMVMIGDYSIGLEGHEISHDELAWWLSLMSNLVLRLRAFEASNPSAEWPGLLRAFAAAVHKTDSHTRS